MKIILLQDVKNLGKKGNVCNVSDGYARNFLLPKKLATLADANALNAIKGKEEAVVHRKAVEKEKALALKDKLDGALIEINAKAGGTGKLFGSVTSKEIIEKINSKFSIEIDKKKLQIEDIKQFGQYSGEIKLPHGVIAMINVLVKE